MSSTDPSISKYPRGSEWRRWDLHVHTPLSALENGFGSDFDAYAKELFTRSVEREIVAIGVTDYFTVEGYKRLREIREDQTKLAELLGEELAETAATIRLFPNVELRLNDFVRVGEKDSRVNAHVIFSDEVDPREIEENFLHQLRFVDDSAPGDSDNMKPLTLANLEAFGAELQGEHEKFKERTALEVGMTQAAVAHEEVSKTLDLNKAFKHRYLFVVAADEDLSEISWDGQGHSTRKALIRKSHMLFSASPGTRSFALGEKSPSVAAFEEEFRGRKPCIHGSDAHSIERLFHFDEDRQLWVRADPTFDGLVQLCHEPEDRVFIGPEPPAMARIRSAASKVIDEVAFERDAAAGADAQWFNGSVPLNPGLVAIIGKKGGGKSALADVIGLLGDAQTRDDFSFLSERRFLDPNHALGRHFDATLTWRDGETTTRTLDAEVNKDVPERIKHIPQNYLEQICEEIQQSSAPTLFDHELEGVIFSHVPQADRLGHTTLDALFRHTTEETEARIKLLRQKLGQVNREYQELRRRSSAEARTRLEGELAQRRAELEARKKAAPEEVPDPSKATDSSPEAEQVEKDLDKVVAEIEQLDKHEKELRSQDEQAKRRRIAAQRMLGRIENLETSLEEFYDQSIEDAELLKLDPRKLVKLEKSISELTELQSGLNKQIDEIAKSLDEARGDSDIQKRAKASEHAEDLRKKLAEPQRRREEYLRARSAWQKEVAAIEGSSADPKSVKGLEAQLADLKKLPDLTQAKRDERAKLVDQIYTAKAALLESYRELYRPVQAFMKQEGFDEEVDALSFDAEITVDGLEDGMLGLIHQGRKGSFQGEQEGRERLRGLIRRNDFSTPEGVKKFLEDIGDHLAHDVRDERKPTVGLGGQLMRGRSAEDVYDFLFGLEYLQPRFKLLWRGKPIDQLSPGERGTLLLIFYLLIDREETPLVIDQPEENLDNETVAELLVPAIKNAKERRQIIMVTHNPNLAVVCDADQVIHATIDKVNGNRVTYTSGSIENPTIAQMIVNVLEGTKPAFDLRDAKYEVLDRVR